MPRPTVYRNFNPDSQPEVEGSLLEDMSYDDLYQMAKDQKVPGRSSMTKEDLIAALES